MIAEALRRFLRLVIPVQLRDMRGAWLRRRVRDATAKVQHLTGGRVQSGPFTGMQYIGVSHSSELGPKLLGTYELELEQIVVAISAGTYGSVVDIGAAEGYYACGLLCRNPTLEVIAFESSASARADLRRLATLNGIRSGLRIEAECTPLALSAVLAGMRRACLIVDIDGGEKQLLDMVQVPPLRDAHMLVEVHDFIDPEISKVLLHRFRDSHTVLRIPQTRRGAEVLPSVPGLSRSDLRRAADEARPGRQEWLWMCPKPEPGQPATGVPASV